MCSKCISIATYTVAGSRSVKFFVVTQGVEPSLEHLLGQRQLSKAAMLLRGNSVKLIPIISYPWRVMIPLKICRYIRISSTVSLLCHGRRPTCLNPSSRNGTSIQANGLYSRGAVWQLWLWGLNEMIILDSK